MAMSRRIFLQGISAAGMAPLAASALTKLGPDAETFVETATDAPHPLTPVPLENVTIDDAFWAPKREIWRTVTVSDCFHKFDTVKGSAFENFDRVTAGKTDGHAGFPWFDGLVYEMIRGVADFLRSHPDPQIEAQIDGYVTRIAAAASKDPGGYVNTYTQLQEPDHRWGLNGGLEVWQHEFYNLGALVEAGVHYYRATGKTQLLDAAVRIANTMDDLVGAPPKKNLVPAHELPEEAMLGLYELLTEQPNLRVKLTAPADAPRYLRLAEFWIENRGHNAKRPDWTDRPKAEEFVRKYDDYAHGRPTWGDYAQDETPIFEQTEVVGHAVRSTLLCSAVAATARVNNKPEYRDTALRLWENMTYRRMHITGGVGAYAEEEKFGPDYVLPNNAYLETCAAVGAGFFHANMNRTFGNARYMDEFERVLYNGVLCGVSLKGDTYTYENPIETSKPRERWEWHDCPCCPPMFLKMMGAMPGMIYATDADSAYVNLFAGGHASMKVGGKDVVLRQTTQYPWDGKVRISVEPATSATFGLMVRIPAWSHGAKVSVNGHSVSTGERVRGYVRIEREWKKGDIVEVSLPMPVEAVRANPRVATNLGRVALMRGPLVYCVETPESDNSPILLSKKDEFTTEVWPERLGGVVAIRAAAVDTAAEEWLYSNRSVKAGATKPVIAIPFYANANSGPAKLMVWLPRES